MGAGVEVEGGGETELNAEVRKGWEVCVGFVS